jgi:hypothetical protein
VGLEVWSVCVGEKYTDDDVHILKDMVARNLGDHRFRCLSDRSRSGIDCTITGTGWPGWWSKLELFLVAKGPTLYLDLDTVVVDELTPLLSRSLSMPANWAQSGHGGCQSSVMSWSGDYSAIAKAFNPRLLHEPESGNYGRYGDKRLWGDQEFITEQMGEPRSYAAYGVTAMRGVVSYKYHCRQGLPEGARVVCFHGTPKPSEVSDSWVKRARSSTLMAGLHTK